MLSSIIGHLWIHPKVEFQIFSIHALPLKLSKQGNNIFFNNSVNVCLMYLERTNAKLVFPLFFWFYNYSCLARCPDIKNVIVFSSMTVHYSLVQNFTDSRTLRHHIKQMFCSENLHRGGSLVKLIT